MPESLHLLTSKMRACARCKGLELGPKPIFQLDERVKVLIAGQAPGRLAHTKNRPFDDPSGDRLRNWLGVDRFTFYDDKRIGIFPMGLCYPGSGSGGDKPPMKTCAATWRPPVLQALGKVELTLVLGRYAVAWHLPNLRDRPVTEAVRRSSEGRKGIFVLPHPSPRNNRWLKKNAWFEAQVVPRIRSKMAQVLDNTAVQ